MESNRRFRRPRIIVDRAVRKMRARAASIASTNSGTDKVRHLNYPHPHLSLVPDPAPVQEGEGDMPELQTEKKPPRRFKPVLILILLLVLAAVAALAAYERRTSTMQAEFFSRLASKLDYKVEIGRASGRERVL